MSFEINCEIKLTTVNLNKVFRVTSYNFILIFSESALFHIHLFFSDFFSIFSESHITIHLWSESWSHSSLTLHFTTLFFKEIKVKIKSIVLNALLASYMSFKLCSVSLKLFTLIISKSVSVSELCVILLRLFYSKWWRLKFFSRIWSFNVFSLLLIFKSVDNLFKILCTIKKAWQTLYIQIISISSFLLFLIHSLSDMMSLKLYLIFQSFIFRLLLIYKHTLTSFSFVMSWTHTKVLWSSCLLRL